MALFWPDRTLLKRTFQSSQHLHLVLVLVRIGRFREYKGRVQKNGR